MIVRFSPKALAALMQRALMDKPPAKKDDPLKGIPPEQIAAATDIGKVRKYLYCHSNNGLAACEIRVMPKGMDWLENYRRTKKVCKKCREKILEGHEECMLCYEAPTRLAALAQVRREHGQSSPLTDGRRSRTQAQRPVESADL
jgi:hypothetical protein